MNFVTITDTEIPERHCINLDNIISITQVEGTNAITILTEKHSIGLHITLDEFWRQARKNKIFF